MRSTLWGVAAMLLVVSCSKDSATDPKPSGSIQPTFTSIQSNLFNFSCTSSSCHGSTARGGLSLVAGQAYGNLVNVRSLNDGANAPPFFRVHPGKPDSSFLYIKLTSPNAQQDSRMPQTGGALPDEYIAAVRTWIENGAQNN